LLTTRERWGVVEASATASAQAAMEAAMKRGEG
jgi:hypothetical protein